MIDDLVKRLRNTPNWMREGFQDWKDNVRTYDRAPFEAADRIEELAAKLDEALRALERIELSTDTREQGAIAMATLAELKGQDDD